MTKTTSLLMPLLASFSGEEKSRTARETATSHIVPMLPRVKTLLAEL